MTSDIEKAVARGNKAKPVIILKKAMDSFLHEVNSRSSFAAEGSMMIKPQNVLGESTASYVSFDIKPQDPQTGKSSLSKPLVQESEVKAALKVPPMRTDTSICDSGILIRPINESSHNGSSRESIYSVAFEQPCDEEPG